MSEVTTTVIGIDVGGERKGFHAVALQNGTFVATLAHSDPAAVIGRLYCFLLRVNSDLEW